MEILSKIIGIIFGLLAVGVFYLEIQKNRIVSTMNHVAIGLRRRLRSILDFETIYIIGRRHILNSC